MKYVVTYGYYEDGPKYALCSDCWDPQLFETYEEAAQWLQSGVPTNGEKVKVNVNVYHVAKNGSTKLFASGNIDYRNDPVFQVSRV